MSSSGVAAVVGVALALGGGCADWSRGGSAGDAGAGDGNAMSLSDGGVGFGAVVHPLLVSGCGDCHASEGEAGRTMFVLIGMAVEDYAATVAFVDAASPAASRLLVKMSGAGHGGGAVFASDSPEFATVLRWIEEGVAP